MGEEGVCVTDRSIAEVVKERGKQIDRRERNKVITMEGGTGEREDEEGTI